MPLFSAPITGYIYRSLHREYPLPSPITDYIYRSLHREYPPPSLRTYNRLYLHREYTLHLEPEMSVPNSLRKINNYKCIKLGVNCLAGLSQDFLARSAS